MGETYFELVKPTYIENWNHRLYSYSAVMIQWPLKKEYMYAIQEGAYEPEPEHLDVLKGLEKEVDDRLCKFPGKVASCRLGSRSPKDAYALTEIEKIKSGRDLVTLFLNSQRVLEDLELALINEYTPYVVLREWVDIEPWQEYRCFVVDRKLCGISQYWYRDYLPEAASHAGSIQWIIRQMAKDILPLLPADSCIYDVYVKILQKKGPVREWGVRLIEVNPFFEWTDPCLFSWQSEDIKVCEIRFLDKGKNVRSLACHYKV